jgi:G3E family GTPase
MEKLNSLTLPIPTNIITGFLGAGKTTLIQHLLTLKPANERWAILVNEFGEIGIDGAFFKGRPENNIYVRQVPGGCMCCTSGLPMQIALNQLISYAKPHRLLIEPTGLGHPKEVLASLQQAHYQDTFSINSTLTLVDARLVTKERYNHHQIFREQLEIADHIVATKADLYEENDQANLTTYLTQLNLATTPLTVLDSNKITLSILSPKTKFKLPKTAHHEHGVSAELLDIEEELSNHGKVKVSNDKDDFYSCGWAFRHDKVFDFTQVMNELTTLDVYRLKAVMITDKGIFTFNKLDEVLSCNELDESMDSRLEVITTGLTALNQIVETLESTLFAEN